jgi:hypothetical protein
METKTTSVPLPEADELIEVKKPTSLLIAILSVPAHHHRYLHRDFSSVRLFDVRAKVSSRVFE